MLGDKPIAFLLRLIFTRKTFNFGNLPSMGWVAKDMEKQYLNFLLSITLLLNFGRFLDSMNQSSG
jgi:hypothetical protein